MKSNHFSAKTSIEIERAIRCDQICDQFEVAWLTASNLIGRPHLETHLALGSEQDQSFLLQELIRLDVHYRRAADESPQVTEYLQRFPCLLPTSLDEIFCRLTQVIAQPWAGSTLVGRTFADYEVLGEIARGGMGVVYRARQISLNRIVALKMILSGAHASAADIIRFRTEAEAAANLNHSGIVPIHEVGEREGQHYFSMGYVKGQSLASRLVDAPLSPRTAAEILRQVARAVQYAHDQQVIHRDLKPANILLDEADRPLITDFGLARQLSRNSSLTNTGDMLGTPCFMSPEQASGGALQVGPSTDIYALGAVLYATLTGRPPFQAATPMATLQQVLNDEPVAPSRLNRAVPKDLETISLKCLAKSTSRRYASAAALADDLDRWLQGEAILRRPTPVAERMIKWARRRPAIAGLSASLVAITLIAFALVASFWMASIEAAHIARRLAARFALDKATSLCESGDVNRGLLMYDYTLSLVPSQDEDLRNSVLANIAAWKQEAIPMCGLLPHPDAIVAQQFSPNNEYLLTVCKDHCVRVWSVRTGELLGEIAHTDAIRVAIFSPGSKYILTGCDNGGVRFWNLTSQTGEPKDGHAGPITAATFCGAGMQAATGSKEGVMFWNSPPGANVPKIVAKVTALAISKDGKLLAVGIAGGGVQLWNMKTAELATAVMEDAEGEIDSLKFGGDGALLLATAKEDRKNGMIHVWRTATGKLVPGLAGRWETAEGDLDRVQPWVFTAGADFTAELWDLQAEAPEKLLRLKHDDAVGTVTINPKDSGLLLTGNNSSVARLWDRKTGLPIGPALQHPSPLEKVAFSPDGEVFSTICRDTMVRLWKTPRRRDPTIVHSDAAMAVAVSSKGLIATGTSAGIIHIHTKDGSEIQKLTTAHNDEIWALAFSSDGQTLITTGRDGKVISWDTESFRRTKSEHNVDKVRSLSISADDHTFLIGCGTIKNGFAQLRDTATAEPIGSDFAGEDNDVWAVAMAPLPSHAACAISSGESSIQLFRKLELGVVPQRREDFVRLPNLKIMHQSRVVALAFSPNGKWLVTGSTDQTARLWDAATGEPVGAELRHGSAVWSATFSRDSRFLVTGCGDGTVHVWDVVTGAPIGPVGRHQGTVWSVACDPSGNAFWSAGEDGRIYRWQLPSREPELARAKLAVEVLTGMEFDETQSARWLDADQWGERQRTWEQLEAREESSLVH